MEFASDPTRWRTRFAFFPVQIGEDNGHRVYVWLQTYQVRFIKSGYRVPAWEYRSPTHPHLKPFCVGDFN